MKSTNRTDAIRKALAERKKQPEPPKQQRKTHERLPHGSTFLMQYDATEMMWQAYLMIPTTDELDAFAIAVDALANYEIAAKHEIQKSAVITCMVALDRKHRRNNGASKDKDRPVQPG